MSTSISVRLDDEAARALAHLVASGLSRSDAIRLALVEAVHRRQRDEVLRAEVAALEADGADRAEMLGVAAFMESLRASG